MGIRASDVIIRAQIMYVIIPIGRVIIAVNSYRRVAIFLETFFVKFKNRGGLLLSCEVLRVKTVPKIALVLVQMMMKRTTCLEKMFHQYTK